MKIAITGSTGLVGSRVIELLKNDFEFIPLTQEELDITNNDSVKKRFETIDADLLLHLAAYTNVDAAETDRETAKKINVDGTRNLFEAAKQKNMRFIYISTDFVFDGEYPPFDEDSKPNPIGYYGQTKYEGELILHNNQSPRTATNYQLPTTNYQLQPNAMIVRITYPYRKSYDARPDFMRSIKRLLSEGKTIAGITDSTFTPTFIDDIAYGLKHLMNNFKPEIYHLVGSQTHSPYEAFKAIARTFGLNESLIMRTTYDEFFADRAKRPRHGQTISKKNTFHKMLSFEEGLKQCA